MKHRWILLIAIFFIIPIVVAGTLHVDGNLWIWERLKINNYWMPLLDGNANQVIQTDGNGNLFWGTMPDVNSQTINYWTKSGTNLYYNLGNIQVGPTNKTITKTLDVSGHINYNTVSDVTTSQLNNLILTENINQGSTFQAGTYYVNFAWYTGSETSSMPNTSNKFITISAGSTITISNLPVSTDPRVLYKHIYLSNINDNPVNYTYFQYLNQIISNNTTTYTITSPTINVNDRSYWKNNNTAGKTYINGILTSYIADYDTYVGSQSFISTTTTATANTGLGKGTGTNVSSGSYNTALGYYALPTTTTGSDNIAIGYASLQGNLTGGSNISIGNNTLRNYGTQNQRNVAVGERSFYLSPSNLVNNVGVGYYTGYKLSGTGNILVGYYAGSNINNTVLNYNTIVGYNAGTDLNSSNNILIGLETNLNNKNTSNQLNIGNLIYGLNTKSGSTPNANNGKIGINNNNPAYPLDVNGNVNGISIYADKNISASGYITRTNVYDKINNNNKKAIDSIKDASEYLNPNGTINHNAFEYSKVEYPKNIITGYTIAKQSYEECDEIDYIDDEGMLKLDKNCITKTKDVQIPIYNTIIEKGVSLDKEVALIKQAVYELKIENELLKTELCKKDKSYKWCIT